jgi:hypothetical protein
VKVDRFVSFGVAKRPEKDESVSPARNIVNTFNTKIGSKNKKEIHDDNKKVGFQ